MPERKHVVSAMKIIITCEHGGNIIPGQYSEYFATATEDLNSHKGLDIGALHLFDRLAAEFADYSISSQISRLLVDLNRSSGSNTLFSGYSQPLPVTVKDKILKDFYFPYRKKVEEKVKEFTDNNYKVFHLSVHSFTPVFDGEIRKNDIGILFDTDRSSELKICNKWKKLIENFMPGLVVMFNYPYSGTTDGLTKSLREKFPENYSGIELEINQKHSVNNLMNKNLLKVIVQSVEKLLHHEEVIKI